MFFFLCSFLELYECADWYFLQILILSHTYSFKCCFSLILFFFSPSLILSPFHLGSPIIWMLDFSSCLGYFFVCCFSSCFWAWIFYNNLFFDHEFLYLYFLKQWLPCKVNYFTFQFYNLLVVFVDFYLSSEVRLSILLRSFIL